MRTETYYCDLCGYKFAPQEEWDGLPCKVEFNLKAPPRQKWESAQYEHVCRACANTLIAAFYDAVRKREDERCTRPLE